MNIDVYAETYIYEGVESPLETIPADAYYECHKRDANGELLYLEHREDGYTRNITSKSGDDNLKARAEAVLEHALSCGMNVDPFTAEVEVFVELGHGALGFETPTLPTDEITESAVFIAKTNDQLSSLEVGNVEGYLYGVVITEPYKIPSVRAVFNSNKELVNVQYIFPSLNEERLLVSHFSFTEFTELGARSISRSEDDDSMGEMGEIILSAVGFDTFNDVMPYVVSEYVGCSDFEGNVIDIQDTPNHSEHIRQWINESRDIKVREIVMQYGIAQTEIYDVPQSLHRKVLHAYMRNIHLSRQLISLSHEGTRYVMIFEPRSTESTQEVPLEGGQVKMSYSTYTVEGTYVVSECIVFNSENEPVKKYMFGSPNEVNLMNVSDV